ncbi:LnmK family bifunctional acyltransferase/decarboxylase [Streptomyces goshikiensis]|uniref:LnmK family bifunctional acyltransferase/decarboxylase n=1 Tax=Streptomyces goshikiensis TaxID=1942 RepID=UPI00367B93B7
MSTVDQATPQVRERHVTITPSMCGPNALLFGTVGDWTWEAVGEACAMDAFRAVTHDGRPAYLAFHYYRIRAGLRIHPYALTFGDRLTVQSRVYGLSNESVVTLHRLAPENSRSFAPLAAAEFHDHPRQDCLYIENYNRWISRSMANSNQALVSSAPAGFRHTHLPALPAAYSPRKACGTARRSATFHPAGVPGSSLTVPDFQTTYRVGVRDLNGVGLLYFAAYFGIFDSALHRLWSTLGRSDQDFLARHLLDHRIGYFSNADPGTVLRLTARLWTARRAPYEETVDLAARNEASGELVAVAAMTFLPPAGPSVRKEAHT